MVFFISNFFTITERKIKLPFILPLKSHYGQMCTTPLNLLLHMKKVLWTTFFHIPVGFRDNILCQDKWTSLYIVFVYRLSHWTWEDMDNFINSGDSVDEMEKDFTKKVKKTFRRFFDRCYSIILAIATNTWTNNI